MLKHFFTSQTRIKLLTLFLTNPEKEFFIRELGRLTNITMPSISKELKNLEAVDFIKSRKSGSNIYYLVNKNHPLYTELKNIIYKTEGVGDELKNTLLSVGHIKVALIFGSVAKGKEKNHSDIDLLIIGNPDMNELYKVIGAIEKKLSREINFVNYSVDEWKKKVEEKSSFAVDILNNQVITLIGDINEI